jgi:hypothetical protein
MASYRIDDGDERFDQREHIHATARERAVRRPSFERRSSRIYQEVHTPRHRSRSPPPQEISSPVSSNADSDEEETIQERIIHVAEPHSREYMHRPAHVRPNTFIHVQNPYTTRPRNPSPPPPVYLTEETHRPVHDTTHRTPTHPIIIETAPRNPQTRHRRRHRASVVHEVPRPRTHETLVSVPTDHDVEEDFFEHGRGMWDMEMLLRQSQVEERQRADRAASMQQQDRRHRMSAQDEEARRRYERARDELDQMRRSMRRPQHSASPSGPGPSRWGPGEEGGGGSRKGKEREKEKEKGDGCCEKLLAFLQQDAEVQHYRWREMRDWNALLVGDLIRSRQQAVVVPSWQQTNIIVNSQNGGGGQGTDGNTNTFMRPSMLGEAHHELGLTAERHIKVGFMFLRDGKAVMSKYLYKYLAVRDMTEQHDMWLIKHMTKFYAKHVATRRWIPCKKRLALAKFVRVSGYPPVNYWGEGELDPSV